MSTWDLRRQDHSHRVHMATLHPHWPHQPLYRKKWDKKYLRKIIGGSFPSKHISYFLRHHNHLVFSEGYVYVCGIQLPCYVKQISLDLGIKLPVSKYGLLSSVAYASEVSWNELCSAEWFVNIGLDLATRVNRSVFLPYPEFVQTNSPVLYLKIQELFQSRVSPICPCVFITCRAVCSSQLPLSIGVKYPLSSHLAGNLGRLFCWMDSRLMFLKADMLIKGHSWCGRKGVDSGQSSGQRAASPAHCRALFCQLVRPLLPRPRLAGKHGIFIFKLAVISMPGEKRGRKGSFVLGLSSRVRCRDIPPVPWTFWNEGRCQLAPSPIGTTRKFGRFIGKKKVKKQKQPNCLQVNAVCRGFKGLSGSWDTPPRECEMCVF